jgi:hypothetical protein
MPICTTGMNQLMNKVICEKLGVDEFYYDFERQFTKPPSLEIRDKYNISFLSSCVKYTQRSFYIQFFIVVKDGKRYQFCIDPEVKTESWTRFFSHGTTTTYDWDAMQKKIEVVLNAYTFYT